MTTEHETLCPVGNIERKGQQRRALFGVVASMAALAGFWITPPGLGRLWLFLPLFGAVYGFAQAQQKT